MERSIRKYGMLYRLIIIVFCSYTFTCEGVFAQEWRMGFCHASDYLNIEHQVPIKKSIDRFIDLLDPNIYTDIRFIECPKIPASTFYGNSEAVYGREEAMAMLVEASYWSAAILATHFENDADTETMLSGCCILDWADAYRLAKAKLFFQYEELDDLTEKIAEYNSFSTPQIQKIKDLVDEIHYEENGYWESDEEHSELFIAAYPIYKAIIDNLVSFIIGHELFHFNDNNQMITTENDMEKSGLFKIFHSLQFHRRLFNHNIQSDVVEINADKSGLRFLQFVDSNTGNHVTDPILRTAIRQQTVNLLAFPVLAGFEITGLEYSGAVKAKLVPGYLYPPIRMMMITATLRANETENLWAVKMCGATARIVTTVIRSYASAYEHSDGEVPDEVLLLLPFGVTTGLETDQWDQNSFICNQN